MLLVITGCDQLNSKQEDQQDAKVQTSKQLPEVREEAPRGPMGKFEFSETVHDFGTVKEGEIVSHVFTFKNTGEGPIVIQNARGSCGCTVPKYSREPVQPGEEGIITVNFNTAGRPNVQNKSVTILANTDPPQSKLMIKAMVTPKIDPNQPMGPVKR